MMRKTLLVALGLVLIAAGGWIASLPGVLTRGSGVCDTEVPVWYPPDEACDEMPALVEYMWPPERWGAPTICTAMCTDPYSDEQLRAEWIRTHRTDSLAE